MSTLIVRTVQTPDGSPVSFPNGLRVGNATGAGTVNHIGMAGQAGFGCGIPPSLPANYVKLYGSEDPLADNYGNYLNAADGSVMVYLPAFYYKYGTGINGFALNYVDIKALGHFADVATANANGYALHRAFYNGGSIRPGVFVDKYFCSNNGGVASSIKSGVPLSSAARGGVVSTSFASLNGAPANAFYGAIAGAKTRGGQFFVMSRFIRAAIALLSLAHASASAGVTFNAWYSAGATNFPKGNNNNALGDANDPSIAYVDDGTGTNCGKTGSANFFSKTTHNGQNCGVADVNGTLWSIEPFGLTSNGTNYYHLNTSADVTAMTGGNTLATDVWGATGLAAMYTSLGATYESLTNAATDKRFGSAAQVLSAATAGSAWSMAGAGVPLVTGVGGSNQFGVDTLYDARPNELCVVSGGDWTPGAGAGVWALYLDYVRDNSNIYCGFRVASYL